MKSLVTALVLLGSLSANASQCTWNIAGTNGSAEKGTFEKVKFSELKTVWMSEEFYRVQFSLESVMVNPDSSVEFIKVLETTPFGAAKSNCEDAMVRDEKQNYVGVQTSCMLADQSQLTVVCKF